MNAAQWVTAQSPCAVIGPAMAGHAGSARDAGRSPIAPAHVADIEPSTGTFRLCGPVLRFHGLSGLAPSRYIPA